jgi:hypothetical protein
MPDWLWVGGWGLSAVEVAAQAPAVGLGSELAFQLHEAPDPGAVGADVGLDLGGQLADGGQVDAEQYRASLQRRRDRPAQPVLPGTSMASDVDILERIGTEGRQVRYQEVRPALGRRPTRTGPVVLDSSLALTT